MYGLIFFLYHVSDIRNFFIFFFDYTFDDSVNYSQGKYLFKICSID